MKQRYILVTIDTIAELLRDYIANPDDLPEDAMPVAMQINPTNKKLAVSFTSDSWKEQPLPLTVAFDIRRLHTVS